AWTLCPFVRIAGSGVSIIMSARRETRDARRETRDARRETRDARRDGSPMVSSPTVGETSLWEATGSVTGVKRNASEPIPGGEVPASWWIIKSFGIAEEAHPVETGKAYALIGEIFSPQGHFPIPLR